MEEGRGYMRGEMEEGRAYMRGEMEEGRGYMRGETKCARAEELLALIKAERELEEIEKNEVPNSLRKCPVLPAIKVIEESEKQIYFKENENIAFHTKSRFIWRDDKLNNTSKTMFQRDYNTYNIDCTSSREYDIMNNEEISHRNLPPLKTTKQYSVEEFHRPSCPSPPP